MNLPKRAIATCALAGFGLFVGFPGGNASLSGQELAGDQDGVASMLVSTALDLFAGDNEDNRPTRVFACL